MQNIIDEVTGAIRGETSQAAYDLEYYSTDGGIFEIKPTAIVFPKDGLDVQKVVRIVKAHADRGDKISLTARGNGTDQGGGPLNNGLILDFTKHMNHIIEMGETHVVVEPGCMYGELQAQLKERGRYIPAYPASVEICTIGGAVANNSAGEKTVRYGATRDYVEAVQVTLDDGTSEWLYTTDYSRLDELRSRRTRLGTIADQIKQLIDEKSDLFVTHDVTKEAAGYAIWKVAASHGFNLNELIVGSQGTLALVTAIRLRTVALPAPEDISLAASYYDSLDKAIAAVDALRELRPSALEIIDDNLINLVNENQPELLEGLLPEDTPKIVLITEFDNASGEISQQKDEKAKAIYDEYAYDHRLVHDQDKQTQLWKLRRSAAAVMWTIPGKEKALPIVEDGTVPPGRLKEFIEGAYRVFEKHDVKIAIWGHAGDADLHMQPFMDLSKKEDRDKVFKLADDFYAMVAELGGTAAGEHNDGLMRAPYLKQMFGDDMMQIFNDIKSIWDPENIFNPHKKVGVDFNYVKDKIRHEYTIESIARTQKTQEQTQDTIDR